MAAVCRHDGFHSVTARYDRERGLLIFLRTCDGCGVVVTEVGRERYRPRYYPLGTPGPKEVASNTLTPSRSTSRTSPSFISKSRCPSTSDSVR